MTTGPAAGFKINLKFWNPNCQISNFKRTPRVLQVSPGAKTECKMTAREPSFEFAEEIDHAMQSLRSKLRKTWYLKVYGAQNEGDHMTRRTEKNSQKNVFFRGGCWRGNLGFFLRFFVNAVFRDPFCTFWLVYAITGEKQKKPKFPHQQRNDEGRNFPTGYRAGSMGWSTVSWARGRLGLFYVLGNHMAASFIAVEDVFIWSFV
jgi:hypothetical protein